MLFLFQWRKSCTAVIKGPMLDRCGEQSFDVFHDKEAGLDVPHYPAKVVKKISSRVIDGKSFSSSAEGLATRACCYEHHFFFSQARFCEEPLRIKASNRI